MKVITLPFWNFLSFPYISYFFVAYSVFIILLALFYLLNGRKKISRNSIFLSFGIITLGLSIGLIMGNNRNPISDTIMSSILSLLGGVITFLFIKKEDRAKDENDLKTEELISEKNRSVISSFLILFPLALLYGAHSGSVLRTHNEEIDRILDYNATLSKDSIELWKKQTETNFEITKIKIQTWGDNEKKRYEFILNHLTKGDTIPNVPIY
jgi:hypothetical protein